MDTNYKMISSLLLAGVSTCGIARQPMQNPMEPVKERPNILVIVCEDISPYLRCGSCIRDHVKEDQTVLRQTSSVRYGASGVPHSVR